MADIFISYKRTRRDVVERLAQVLRAHGWEVWYDARLTEGEQFRKEIETELAASKCAIVVWCDQSIVSDFVLDEAGWAKAQGALIQARWAEVKAPLGFGQQQHVDIIGWRQGVPALSSLITAVERLIGPPDAPTRGAMGTPSLKAKAAAATGTIIAPASVSAHLPPHLALQLERTLRDVMADHAMFDLRLLHPRVRRAAEDARRAELSAVNAQHRALHAAELAEDAARRARAKEPGYRVYTYPNDEMKRSYEGQWVKDTRHGYGVFFINGGNSAGSRYAGQFENGAMSGAGIYYYWPSSTSLRYEGEMTDDKSHGVGAYYWRDGRRMLGEFRHDLSNGSSVFVSSVGLRREGDYVDDKRNGCCVFWDDKGQVSQQGVWTDDVLTTPLSR